ncbi:MAG: septal ring lytic transglycosylase RlpA family protein [Coriobacteriia bacterium]
MRAMARPVSIIAITTVMVMVFPFSASAEPATLHAVDIPFSAQSATLLRLDAEIDAATAQVLDMDAEISELNAQITALDTRLVATSTRIASQRQRVARAEAVLAQAQVRYDAHVVSVYKRGSVQPISILLTSDSLNDLIGKVSVLSRIAEEDSRVVNQLNLAADDARYQAAALKDIYAQDAELRRLQTERKAKVERRLSDQQRLVSELSEQARAALADARRLDAETRARWRASSIPVGAVIPRADATVLPYADRSYLVSAYMPRTYRTTGSTFDAACSWYGPGFNGNGTASGQLFNEDDLTCASRTLPFGTVLALTHGNARIIVYVNDRGPFIAGRDLDLSKAAAQALGITGVGSVHAEIVVPAEDIE